MRTAKEQKILRFILAFYWLSIFIATHIPVPGWTRKMGMSDKTMHFIAYLFLTILLWLSVSLPRKADWRKFLPWLVSAIIFSYAIVDEILQNFAHRSTDIKDLCANMLGAACAMIFVTILPGYHAIMVLVTPCPLFMPAFVRSKLLAQNSVFEVTAYLAIFGAVTLAWVVYLSSVTRLNFRRSVSLPIFFLPPGLTVVMVKLFAEFTNKPFGVRALLAAFAGIILTLFVCQLILKLRPDVEFVKRVADENELP